MLQIIFDVYLCVYYGKLLIICNWYVEGSLKNEKKSFVLIRVVLSRCLIYILISFYIFSMNGCDIFYFFLFFICINDFIYPKRNY